MILYSKCLFKLLLNFFLPQDIFYSFLVQFPLSERTCIDEGLTVTYPFSENVFISPLLLSYHLAKFKSLVNLILFHSHFTVTIGKSASLI